VKHVGYEMIQQLVEQIEATQGYVKQSVTLKVDYTPAGNEDPGAFAIFGKLAATGSQVIRAVKIDRDSEAQQLSMFVGT